MKLQIKNFLENSHRELHLNRINDTEYGDIMRALYKHNHTLYYYYRCYEHALISDRTMQLPIIPRGQGQSTLLALLGYIYRVPLVTNSSSIISWDKTNFVYYMTECLKVPYFSNRLRIISFMDTRGYDAILKDVNYLERDIAYD